MKTYVTSDLHFGHKNIHGPDGFVPTRTHFTATNDMNQALIDAWNAVVHRDDVVYHLGDLSLHMKKEDILSLVLQLKGTIYLVKGNHDSGRVMRYLERETYGKVHYIPMGDIVKRNGVQYLLTHYPQGLGERRKKIKNICGHIHNEVAKDANVLNVGVDSPEIPSSTFGSPILLEDAMDLVDEKHQKYWQTLNQ